MHEIVPGIRFWSTFHEGIHSPVSSYYVEPARALIDPMVPDDGLGVFADLPEPQQILLTNRHHYRHSDRFVAEFGCRVRASRPGMHEFDGTDRPVEPFEFGDEVAPRIVALEVGAICPDETALHIHIGDGAIAIADSILRPPSRSLSFPPDGLLGDDPRAVKAGMCDSLRGLLARGFEHLLLAHGEPIVGGGRSALQKFVEEVGPEVRAGAA